MAARGKWCTDLQKHCIISNCEKRGWQHVSPDEDWTFYWASVGTVHRMFAVDSGFRLADNQVVLVAYGRSRAKNTTHERVCQSPVNTRSPYPFLTATGPNV